MRVTLVGKRSFVCGNSWGLILWACRYYCFCIFVFMWYSVYVFIYGGTVSVLKHFFQNGLCFVACELSDMGISESEHITWGYELISAVHVHLIWIGGGVYLNLYTSSESMNWYLMSMGTSSDTGGVYLNLKTSSENMNSYLMSIWTSSCSLHLILRGISYLSIYFIWKVDCHYSHYELLNTEQFM